MIECWATHILKENIKDRDYVFELYNWLMQEYDTTEWPSNHTDIDIFGEHIHPTLEPVHNFISQQVSQSLDMYSELTKILESKDTLPITAV